MNRTLPPAVARTVHFFETLSPTDTARIAEVYTEDAFFKDPFNEVRGTEAIGRIFAHMFVQVDTPRFVIRDVVCEGPAAFLTWDFSFGLRRPLPPGPCVIHGASHLRYAEDGRIAHHRDYWDTSEEFYAKLPGLGVLMRFLQRRGAVTQRP